MSLVRTAYMLESEALFPKKEHTCCRAEISSCISLSACRPFHESVTKGECLCALKRFMSSKECGMDDFGLGRTTHYIDEISRVGSGSELLSMRASKPPSRIRMKKIMPVRRRRSAPSALFLTFANLGMKSFVVVRVLRRSKHNDDVRIE